ncbi:MAG: YbjN domain-containing protein [Oscillospiraceae bacterium]|nr:YbjN domain-containing protein [Oscillospiraceae bacterium]
MIYPSTKAIQDRFAEKEIKCGLEEHEDRSILHVGVKSKETSFEVLLISRTEKNDVAFRIFNLLKFNQNRLGEVLETVNACNAAYRFLKFNVDLRNLTIDVEYDFPLEITDIGESAYEILSRSANIIDLCYPELTKAISG